MARAILIDPFAETVTEVDIDASDGSAIKDIYKHLHCDCITSVRLAPREVLFVDDVGLYVDDQKFFLLGGYPQPLPGRGIVVGMTEDGSTTGTKWSREAVDAQVRWAPDIQFAGIESEEPRQADGPFGRMTVLSSHATFRRRG